MSKTLLPVIDAYSQACGAGPTLARNSVLRKGIALYIWSTGSNTEIHVPAANELSLFVHLSGSHRARMLGEQGPSKIISKPGDISLIPRGQSFSLISGEEMGFATLLFPAEAPPPRESEPWFRLLNISACIFARHDDFVTANMHALIDAIKSPPRDGLQYFNQMFDSLVFHLARIVDDIEGQLASGKPLDKLPVKTINFDALLDYIEAHLSEKLSLEDLAHFTGMGRSLLAREFRDQIGCAPHQYIIERRIERAKTLLKSEMSVTDVAFELGFSGQSHFSTTFKALTGYVPSSYSKVN